MSRFLCIPYFYHMTLLHQIKNLSEVVYDFSEHRTSNILLFCTKAKRPTSLHQLQILCSVFCTIKKGRVFLDGLNSGEMFVNFSFSEIIVFFAARMLFIYHCFSQTKRDISSLPLFPRSLLFAVILHSSWGLLHRINPSMEALLLSSLTRGRFFSSFLLLNINFQEILFIVFVQKLCIWV